MARNQKRGRSSQGDYRVRKVYKRSYDLSTRSSIPRGLTPLYIFRELKFTHQVTFGNAVAGVPGVRIYGANDMYDPVTAIGGHQPRGFDQIMAFYYNFVVLGAKITVRAASRNTTTIPALVGVTLNGETAAGGSIADYTEMPNTVTRMLAPGIAANNSSIVLSNKMSTKKWFAVKDPKDDDTLFGTTGSSPSRGNYFHVWICDVDATNTVGSTDFVIDISYFAMLKNPKQVGGS